MTSPEQDALVDLYLASSQVLDEIPRGGSRARLREAMEKAYRVIVESFVDGAGECGVEGHANQTVPEILGTSSQSRERGVLHGDSPRGLSPDDRGRAQSQVAGIKPGHSPAAPTVESQPARSSSSQPAAIQVGSGGASPGFDGKFTDLEGL